MLVKLGGLRLGPVKIVAGVIGLLTAAAVWPLAVWLGAEIVLVGVALVAVAGLLLAGAGRRSAARRGASLENRIRAADARDADLRDELRSRMTQLSEKQAHRERELDRRVRQVERSTGARDRRIDDLQRQIGDVARELRDLREHAAADRRRLGEIDDALTATGRDAGAVEDLRAATLASLDELNTTLDGLQQRLDQHAGSPPAPHHAEGAGPDVAQDPGHDVALGDDRRLERIRGSGLFDEDFYRERHAGELDGVDPLVHYLEVGWRRGDDPSPLVDVTDVARRLLARDREPVELFLAREEAGTLPRPVESPVPLRADDRLADLELRWRYLLEGGHHHEHTFVLIRIIGNDLPPRHAPGQSLANLRFMLEHEPDLPGCERRFVLNRIVDPDEEAAVIRCLEEHDAPYVGIPFVWEDYRRAGWRYRDFQDPGYVYGPWARGRPEASQVWLLDHLYHDKNLYAMNNNGARNLALEDGRGRARWVMPWDGNGFVTAAAWEQLTGAIRRRPHLPYVLVPMVRTTNNDDVFDPDFAPNAVEEPQVVFRSDARERFNPDRRYGRRPKAELFQRLAVPGMWDEWVIDPWESPVVRVPEQGRYQHAGYVVRLSSGRPSQETDANERGWRRTVAVQARIDELDRRAAEDRFTPDAGILRPDVPTPVPVDATAADPASGAAPTPDDASSADAVSVADMADSRTPAALADELVMLVASAASDGGSGQLQPITDRIEGILAVATADDAGGDHDEAAADEPEASDVPGVAAGLGWATVILDAATLLRRHGQLPGSLDDALRRVAEHAVSSAGDIGPYGVRGYKDAPITVWQLLDQLAGQAFLGDLGGVIATARCTEDLRAMRVHALALQEADAGVDDGAGVRPAAPRGPVSDPEVERVAWDLLDRALVRFLRTDTDDEDVTAERVDDRAALAAVRAVLRAGG